MKMTYTRTVRQHRFSTASRVLLLEYLESRLLLSSDLVVSGALSASPNSATRGGTVSVSYTLKNQGASTANASTTKIQIKLQGSSTEAYSQLFSAPSLSSSQSSFQTNVVNLPSTLAVGTYVAYAVLDNFSTAGQGSATGNDFSSASNAFNVTAAAQSADLVPQSLNLSASSGTAGSSVQVNFTVANTGTGNSLATTANIRLSPSSSAPSTSDPLLGTVNINALSSGSQQAFTPTYTIPAGTGQKYIWVIVDPSNNANQGANINNDRVFASYNVSAAVQPPSISTVSPTSMPASNSNQTLTVNGSNFNSGATLTFVPPEGGSIASNATKLTFVSSSQITYQFNNDGDSGTWAVTVNNPDGLISSPSTFVVSTSATATDDYPLSLRSAVQDSVVDPWNFPNRECTSYVAWRMNRDHGTTSAPYYFTNYMIGPNRTPGQWSNAENWNDNAVAIGFTVDHIPSVGAIAQWDTINHVAYVESVNSDGTVNVSEYNYHIYTAPGTWSLRSRVSPDWFIHVNTGNITAAPFVSNILPTSMPASNSNQTLTVNGSNFQSGAYLTFVPPEGGSILSTSGKLTFVSSNQITYQFNNANHTGTWSVQVNNPDGQSSGSTSFTVIAQSQGKKGVDYSFARPTPASIVASGYQYAVRYVGGSVSKDITANEAQALQSVGLGIVIVFEDAANRMLAGYDAGVSDVNLAVSQALAAGAPSNFFCYFACDFDAQLSDQPAINSYLDGVASIIGVARTGFYGGYEPLKRVLDAGRASKAWQTSAWSSGNIDPRISLYQDNNTPAAIAGCDTDYAYGTDFGQWTLPGDATGDGNIDDSDLNILLTHFGSAGGRSAGDLTGDGLIGDGDLNILLSHFGQHAASAAAAGTPSVTGPLVPALQSNPSTQLVVSAPVNAPISEVQPETMEVGQSLIVAATTIHPIILPTPKSMSHYSAFNTTAPAWDLHKTAQLPVKQLRLPGVATAHHTPIVFVRPLAKAHIGPRAGHTIAVRLLGAEVP